MLLRLNQVDHLSQRGDRIVIRNPHHRDNWHYSDIRISTTTPPRDTPSRPQPPDQRNIRQPDQLLLVELRREFLQRPATITLPGDQNPNEVSVRKTRGEPVAYNSARLPGGAHPGRALQKVILAIREHIRPELTRERIASKITDVKQGIRETEELSASLACPLIAAIPIQLPGRNRCIKQVAFWR